MDRFREISLLCRLCLDKEQVNVPIFGVNGDIRQIFLKISSCLPVKVSETDPLPKNICEGCSDKLDLLYTFWNTSRDAEKTLLSWLQQVQVDNEISKQISAQSVLVKKETGLIEEVIIKEDKDYTKRVFEEENDETGAPSAKRARRTAAVKAQISISQEESEGEDDVDPLEPLIKVEDESDMSDNECVLVKKETQLTEDVGINEDSEEDSNEICAPPAKRARRTAAVKAQINMSQEESEEEEEEEDDVEDESDMSDDDSTDNQPLSTRTSGDKEHAGPSGMGKEAADAPDDFALIYSCHQCPYRTISSRNFQKHMTATHRHIPQKNETTSQFHCPQCDQAYHKKDNLIMHIRRIHEKEAKKKISVSCKFCDKTYTCSWNLKKHIDRDHRQIVPLFPCEMDGCQKIFKKTNSLKWHQNSAHLVNKETFRCDQCDKLFTHYNLYRKHLLKHKNPELACTTCGKLITSNTRMKIHMRTHTGDRPFKCAHCDKSFISKDAWNCHQVVHTKEKPFKCKVCGRAFTQSSSRMLHIKKFHPEQI